MLVIILNYVFGGVLFIFIVGMCFELSVCGSYGVFLYYDGYGNGRVCSLLDCFLFVVSNWLLFYFSDMLKVFMVYF